MCSTSRRGPMTGVSGRFDWRAARRPLPPKERTEVDASVLGVYGAQWEALATLLGGHGLIVEAVMGGLVVHHGAAELVVICRPRTNDRDHPWFSVELDEPRMDSVVAVKRRLAAP